MRELLFLLLVWVPSILTQNDIQNATTTPTSIPAPVSTFTPTTTPTPPTPTSTATSSATAIDPTEDQQTIDMENLTIVVEYTHPGHSGQSLFDYEHLSAIREFEQRFMTASQYGSFCFKYDPEAACVPGFSIVGTALSGNSVLDIDRMEETFSNKAWRPYVGNAYPHQQNKIRSFFRFGYPLHNFTNAEDRREEQDAIHADWFKYTFNPHLEALVNDYVDVLNITFRGGPFKVYEDLWTLYKSTYGLRWLIEADDIRRYNIFKQNMKTIEYISSLRPGSNVLSIMNKYMHYTHPEFLRAIYARDPEDEIPSHDVYLMWNTKPDLTDYYYPP